MLLEQKAEGKGTTEDIIPLNSNENGTGIAAENEIPSWVQQNIIKLSKEFGVHFIGCEEVALNLFMKIDSKREATEKVAGVQFLSLQQISSQENSRNWNQLVTS